MASCGGDQPHTFYPDGTSGCGPQLQHGPVQVSFTFADGAAGSFESDPITDDEAPAGTTIIVEIEYIAAETDDGEPPVQPAGVKPKGQSDPKQQGDGRTRNEQRAEAWERAWRNFERGRDLVKPWPSIKWEVITKEVEVRDADGAYRRETTRGGRLVID
jgi:hypothetical protein